MVAAEGEAAEAMAAVVEIQAVGQAGMSGVPCPACGSTDSAVKDSRTHSRGVRRRRHCKVCGQRFTTQEIIGEIASIADSIDLTGLSRRHRFALRIMEKAARSQVMAATID